MFSKHRVIVFLISLSLSCYAISQGQETLLVLRDYVNRYKRENPVLGLKSNVRQVQPNVVVLPNVPNNAYGGVPASSAMGSTVIVKMPNDVYNPQMVAIPTRY